MLMVKMLRGQKWIDVNKSFTERVIYKKRNKEVHTTVEKKMFHLVVYSTQDPQAEQKGKKKVKSLLENTN
jgi:hypothetical protein